jgi:hypothetical protein
MQSPVATATAKALGVATKDEAWTGAWSPDNPQRIPPRWTEPSSLFFVTAAANRFMYKEASLP